MRRNVICHVPTGDYLPIHVCSLFIKMKTSPLIFDLSLTFKMPFNMAAIMLHQQTISLWGGAGLF